MRQAFKKKKKILFAPLNQMIYGIRHEPGSF